MRGCATRLAPLLTVAAFLTAPMAASATTLPAAFTPSCPTASSAGGSYGGLAICSGQVPSFDGSPLDVDVTQPAAHTGARHPLIVMLHGFGNNKHEWESTTDAGDGADKYDWNNHWFAQHGYYVLTYTARGFRDSGPASGSSEPPTPAEPFGSESEPNGTIHVKSRDYEIRDTQWLAALVAATYSDVDPGAVAVTGGSYGGGESWFQASQATWDFPHALDPTLPVLQLQVAVPKYPWTDLAYALAPNGHGGGPSRRDIYESSQALPGTDPTATPYTPANSGPLGVPKASWIAGLSASGHANGDFEDRHDVPPPSNQDCFPAPTVNCQESIDGWNARLTVTGDPYSNADPVLIQAARGLTVLRSAYYQTPGWTREAAHREVAVFSIQGWTDDLFEPVESFRMFTYLKRLDPRWPVEVRVADIGHSRAQNPPAQWQRLNHEAFAFLQSQIGGSHRSQTTVGSLLTVCQAEPDQAGNDPAQEVTATSPEGLSSGTLSITYSGGTHTLINPLGATDPNGAATDPVVGGDVVEPGEPCRTDRGPATGGYTGYSQPLPDHTLYVGLGEVDVPYTLTPALAQAQIDARVWDVPPSGPAFLMTRGTYRFDPLNHYDAPTGTVRLPLFGNEWRLAPGHRIRLDLTQVDTPFLRANDTPSSISYGSPVLVLPTREAQRQSLAGTP